MNRFRIIDRVRKILARARGSAPEALSAQKLADKLISEHKITKDELKVKEEQKKIVNHDSEIAPWHALLAKAISILNNCQAGIATHKKGIVFIGEPEAIESASRDHNWFKDKIEWHVFQMRKQTYEWQQSFGKGIVVGTVRKIREFLQPKKQKTLPISRQNVLAVQEPKNTTDTIQGLPSSSVPNHAPAMIDKNAFLEGFKIGIRMNMPPWIEPDELNTVLSELDCEYTDDFDWEDMI